MLVEDPARTHLPGDAARIAVLYEATNQSMVQPQGRSAQSAQAVVVALSDGAVFEPVVALTLMQSGETVIYAGQPVAEAALAAGIEEALNFAESMGFILDASGWQNLDEERRAELIARLPAFRPPVIRKEAAPLERAAAKGGDPMAAVARLFAAFCFVLLASCTGPSAEQRAQAAEIHQQLGDNMLHDGNAQEALKEYLASIESEETPEARLGIGLIYAWSLGRPADGEREFKRALELRPDYAEALTNLGALYISRARFAEAVPLLKKAAVDPLYKSRVIAQSNLGWALYKSGDAEQGIGEIKGALKVAPKYCLGWRQLGTIYAEQGKLEQAADAYTQYADACPDVLDAHLQAGKVLARLSKAADARAAFTRCAVAKDDKDKPVAAECARFLKELGTP